MRDKQGQQRRWRADGAIRSSVDRRPMGEGPALASSSTFATTRRTATGLRPQGARRPFVDSAQRRSLAGDRKSTRLNSSHLVISYAVFCLKKKKKINGYTIRRSRRHMQGP